jgi:pimeloyl-ACP methyl ester carboxylesterase
MIIDGIKVNYKIEGAGGYIFLLHGWASNLELYNDLSKFLSKKYMVISFDFPGAGKTPEPDSAWDLNAFTDWTIKFIQSFNVKKAILLGHSFGGRVIIKVLNKKLNFAVHKIILVDSAGIPPKRTLKNKAKILTYKTGKKFLELKPIKKKFPDAIENYKKKLGSFDYKNASEIMRATLVKTVNEDLQPLLKNIKAETLLIWGENDEDTPLSDAKIMEREIPNAGLAVIKNAGHFSFLDAPNLFNKILSAFI